MSRPAGQPGRSGRFDPRRRVGARVRPVPCWTPSTARPPISTGPSPRCPTRSPTSRAASTGRRDQLAQGRHRRRRPNWARPATLPQPRGADAQSNGSRRPAGRVHRADPGRRRTGPAAGHRHRGTRGRRTAAAAPSSRRLFSAQSRVRGVSDFIDTRRGSIGPEARTRLAEAGPPTRRPPRHKQGDQPAPRRSRTPTVRPCWPARPRRWPTRCRQGTRSIVQRSGGFGGGGGSNIGAVMGGIIIGNILSRRAARRHRGRRSEAPRYPLRRDLHGARPRTPAGRPAHDPERREAVEAYRRATSSKSDLDRTDLAKTKSGVPIGASAVNPVTGRSIPIWIADYVLMGYGTGAIMAVPGHDIRDFEFAQKFELPILRVVARSAELASEPIETPRQTLESPSTLMAASKESRSTGCRPTRPSPPSPPGSNSKDSDGRRSTTSSATGCSAANATGVSHSPSCSAKATRSKPSPSPNFPCSCPNSTTSALGQAGTAARQSHRLDPVLQHLSA